MHTGSTRRGIPKVTLVMGLACAAPFVLAVLDDERGGGGAAADDDDGYAGSRRAAERAAIEAEAALAEAALAAEAAEAATPMLSVDALINDVVAPARATPGPLLRGVVLGASSGDFLPDEARARVVAFEQATGASVDYGFDQWSLGAVSISGPADDAEVGLALARLWGEPTMVGSRKVWLGQPVQGPFAARASLDTRFDEVTLLFDRYLPLEAFAAGERGPLPVLGARLDRLGDVLGAAVHGEEGRYVASLPGVGAEGQECTVDLAGDLRTGLVRQYVLVCDGPEQVRDLLIERWGEPTIDRDTGELRWRTGKLKRELVVVGGMFHLTVSS